MNEMIVGLDIGTTKICTVVGEVTGSDLNIIGIGSYPSVGLRKGVVVDIDATVKSIKKAIEEAELMAGCEISSVYTGIAGGHITGLNSQGVIAVKGPEITKNDVDRVVDAAKAIAIPMDREVIHIIEQEFIVDDEPGIQNPVGMSGIRLEAKIHIVTGAIACAHNIIKCANRAGLDVCEIVLEALASGESVLSEEEKEIGVGLIDIGGGTADLAVFSRNHIRHTFVLALGGNSITNDISIGLKIPVTEAEEIKIAHGTCLSDSIKENEFIEILGMGGRKPRKLPKQILTEIIEPRVEEMFFLIKRELFRAGMEDMITSGLVITGGTALLEGVAEVAESVFDMPVRIGTPTKIKGLVDVVNNPMYATGVGLINFGINNISQENFKINDSNIFQRIINHMKKWFSDII